MHRSMCAAISSPHILIALPLLLAALGNLAALLARPGQGRPACRVPIVKTAAQSGQTGMATVAIIRAPGNFSIMALAAKPALNNIFHFYIVAASPHLEDFRMAYITGETQTMEPMREYNGAHPLLFGAVINDHVGIFRMRH